MNEFRLEKALDPISETEQLKSYLQTYVKAKKECLEETHGKTPQFWMQYLNAVECFTYFTMQLIKMILRYC